MRIDTARGERQIGLATQHALRTACRVLECLPCNRNVINLHFEGRGNREVAHRGSDDNDIGSLELVDHRSGSGRCCRERGIFLTPRRPRLANGHVDMRKTIGCYVAVDDRGFWIGRFQLLNYLSRETT